MSVQTGSAEPALDLGRALRFHPLTFLDEGEDVVVGRPDLDAYVVIPADGAALLRRLYLGDDPARSAHWYANEFGETVDLDDFLGTLRELDFLLPDAEVARARIDSDRGAADGSDQIAVAGSGESTADGPAATPGGPVRWQRLGSALFAPPALVAYLAVVAGGAVVAITEPTFAPRHDNVFFTPSLVVIELSLFVLQFPLVLVHELAHVLAGRRLGLRTRVRVSRRLYFIVFETVMNGLVAVPRSRRYLPMLAGMFADLVIASGFTVAAWLLRQSESDIGLPSRLCLALAFTTLLRIAWQLYFFLRTDVYYLISTVLGCVDLHTTTRQYLANVGHRLLGRPGRQTPPEKWHPRDRAVARWYAPLVVLGYTLAIGLTVLVMVPIAWTFLSSAVQRAFLGQASSDQQAWDAILVLGLNAAQFALAGILALRERLATRVRPRHLAVRPRRPGRHRSPR